MRSAAGQWTDDFCAAAAPVPHVDAGTEPPDAGPLDAAPHVDAAPDATDGRFDAGKPVPPKGGCTCAAGTPAGAAALAIFASVLWLAVLGRRRRK